MKISLFFFIILIVAGGWTATQYVQRASKSSDEKSRFIKYAENYNENTKLYLTEKMRLHHDEAFEASYRMWILSPVSDLDLKSYFDEQKYYRTLGKSISEDAKKEGRGEAYTALIDMAEHYGVEIKSKAPPKTASQPAKKKDSKLKSGKLGDKRKIPSSRRRDHDR